MPAFRTIVAVDDLPHDVAVALTRNPETGDEVWQISKCAPVEQIVAECNEVFADMSRQAADAKARCVEFRSHGRRRALWLLLAAVVGLVLPSPVRALYRHHHELLHVLDPVSVAVVAGLLLLALREHVAMRRI